MSRTVLVVLLRSAIFSDENLNCFYIPCTSVKKKTTADNPPPWLYVDPEVQALILPSQAGLAPPYIPMLLVMCFILCFLDASYHVALKDWCHSWPEQPGAYFELLAHWQKEREGEEGGRGKRKSAAFGSTRCVHMSVRNGCALLQYGCLLQKG